MNYSNKPIDIIIRREVPEDNVFIEALGAETFGPGRFSRSAFRLREGVQPNSNLSFVADCDGTLTGSVRLTPILIGGKQALVLGPLMILPSFRNLGIGKELMNRSMMEAAMDDHDLVVLVGDYAYYKPFNFEPVPVGQIVFPGPADPSRILACELKPGVLCGYEGETKRDFSGK